jgi:uncharacterized membrane protein (DUF485 family)
VTTERVYDNEAVLRDPAFQALMSKRSRLRWGMTTVMVFVYLVYGFAGLYFPEVMALPSFGTSMPWVMSLGFLITVLSIVLSIAYIHIVGGLAYDAGKAGVEQQ